MCEFKGGIKLLSFSDWKIESIKSKADEDGCIECPHCNGCCEVLVFVELPSGREIEVEDECMDCEDGLIHISEVDDKDLSGIVDKNDYRRECAESVRLLSYATKSDYFLNLCKAKEMHK